MTVGSTLPDPISGLQKLWEDRTHSHHAFIAQASWILHTALGLCSLSPARLQRVGGRALVLGDLYLLHLDGNMLQLEVKLAQEVVPRLRSKT